MRSLTPTITAANFLVLVRNVALQHLAASPLTLLRAAAKHRAPYLLLTDQRQLAGDVNQPLRYPTMSLRFVSPTPNSTAVC